MHYNRRWLAAYVGRREHAERAMRTIEELRKTKSLSGQVRRQT
jgi:hypothetical protein